MKKNERWTWVEDKDTKAVNNTVYLTCLLLITGITAFEVGIKSISFFLIIWQTIGTYYFFSRKALIKKFTEYNFWIPFICGLISAIATILLSSFEVLGILPIIGEFANKQYVIWYWLTQITTFLIPSLFIIRAVHLNIMPLQKDNEIMKSVLKSYKLFIETVGLVVIIVAFLFVIQGHYDISQNGSIDSLVKGTIAFPLGVWLCCLKIHYEHLKI